MKSSNCMPRAFLNTAAILLFAVFLVMYCATASTAQMKPMSDNEMQAVTAQSGFAEFKMNDGTAEAIFHGLELGIKAQFDSWNWGHWNNGDGLGWDNKWPGVELHSDGFIGIGSGDAMGLKGFFMEADFDNIDSPSDRQLNYVKFGFKEANGLLDPDDFEKASMIADGEEVAHREHLEELGGLVDINDLHFSDDSFEVRIQLRDGPHEDSGVKIPKGIWAESDAGKLDLAL